MPTSLSQAELAKLLMQHRASLYGYLFACVRDHNDAEDLLQTVSMVATESLGQLRDADGFLPWAREIARRRVLAHFRKSRREVPVDPEVAQRLAEAAERLENKEPASDQMVALKACLEELSEENRELICLRYDNSVNNVEALALQFGRSVQGIYAKLKRLKALLRECVERRLSTEGTSS